LIDRAKVICQNHKYFNREVKIIKQDVTINGYSQRFIDSVMKSRKNNNPSTDKVAHRTVVIPHVRGISEKFLRIGNRYIIRTIFKTKHTLRGTLMTTRPDRGLQQKSNVSTIFPVNVADVILVKKADPCKCSSRNTTITSCKVC
jgi:hypothetical protein